MCPTTELWDVHLEVVFKEGGKSLTPLLSWSFSAKFHFPSMKANNALIKTEKKKKKPSKYANETAT